MSKWLKKSWWTHNVLLINFLVNEKELNKLYWKFLSLDKGGKHRLSNFELLSLEELKYNPFRSWLMDAFPLKND